MHGGSSILYRSFGLDGLVLVRQSEIVRKRYGGPEFMVAGVASPRVPDMALAQKLGGCGGEEHVPATRAGRPLKHCIGGASRIARRESHVGPPLVIPQ